MRGGFGCYHYFFRTGGLGGDFRISALVRLRAVFEIGIDRI